MFYAFLLLHLAELNQLSNTVSFVLNYVHAIYQPIYNCIYSKKKYIFYQNINLGPMVATATLDHLLNPAPEFQPASTFFNLIALSQISMDLQSQKSIKYLKNKPVEYYTSCWRFPFRKHSDCVIYHYYTTIN